MRLLIASGIAAPEIGGPATFLAGVRPELEARGHEVRVLAYGGSSCEPEAGGVRRIPRGPLPVRLARYAREYMRGTSWAEVALVLSLALPRPRARRVPVALRVAGDYAWERALNRGWIAPQEELERFEHRRHGWRTEALKAWRRHEARRADLVIVPGEFLRGLVLGWGVDPRRIEVVPNAVRPDPAAAGVTPEEARRRLGWEPDGRYLVAAARLTRWKGIDLVIDAVAAMRDVHLVVAGDGPEAAALRAEAAALGLPVSFAGELSRGGLALCMRAADYVVVYSAYEGLSHTILEALALGTPVIASARGGNPEAVRDGADGLLVPHPDRTALADALRHALAPGVRARLAAGAAAGQGGGDCAVLVERTIALLERLVATRRPTAGRSGRP